MNDVKKSILEKRAKQANYRLSVDTWALNIGTYILYIIGASICFFASSVNDGNAAAFGALVVIAALLWTIRQRNDRATLIQAVARLEEEILTLEKSLLD